MINLRLFYQIRNYIKAYINREILFENLFKRIIQKKFFCKKKKISKVTSVEFWVSN
jgi:hypothetical protein